MSYRIIKNCNILKKYTFLHSTPLNKSIRMGQSPHRNHKISIWRCSEFHLKKLDKSHKKVNKNSKNLIFEEKTHPEVFIALKNICIKLRADWKMFRHRNYDTFTLHTQNGHIITESHNDRITDI